MQSARFEMEHPGNLLKRAALLPKKAYRLRLLRGFVVFFLPLISSSTPWIFQASLRPSFSKQRSS